MRKIYLLIIILKIQKNLQKILFNEIKGRIKLDDETLPYKDHAYEYWTKTTTTGNYFIKLRKKLVLMKLKKFGMVTKKKKYTKLTTGVGDLGGKQ